MKIDLDLKFFGKIVGENEYYLGEQIDQEGDKHYLTIITPSGVLESSSTDYFISER